MRIGQDPSELIEQSAQLVEAMVFWNVEKTAGF
jgi:hypothetical protein